MNERTFLNLRYDKETNKYTLDGRAIESPNIRFDPAWGRKILEWDSDVIGMRFPKENKLTQRGKLFKKNHLSFLLLLYHPSIWIW